MRDYLSVLDLSPEEHQRLILRAVELKKSAYRGEELRGKTFALIFEKPSLRTRTTFEVALDHLGGRGIYLAPGDIRLGVREPVKDVARNLARWVDGIIARVFRHTDLEEMARYADIPVINALSDLEHPCQAQADYQTIYEQTRSFQVRLAFIGDGNNVANSLMLLTAMFGGHFTIACPEGYEPDAALRVRAEEWAKRTGGTVRILRDPREAVRDADFIYTDVWASMGQEAEAELRRRVFAPYQVNLELLRHAPAHAKVLHCLPAHRGEEITEEVLESDRSLVFEQAENRLHTEKALLLYLYGG